MWRIIDIQVVSLFFKTVRKQGRERGEKITESLGNRRQLGQSLQSEKVLHFNIRSKVLLIDKG